MPTAPVWMSGVLGRVVGGYLKSMAEIAPSVIAWAVLCVATFFGRFPAVQLTRNDP